MELKSSRVRSSEVKIESDRTSSSIDTNRLGVLKILSMPESQSNSPSQNPISRETLYVSPLIQITLLLLYLALTLPLPFLSNFTHAAIPASWLSIGLAISFVFLYGALSDRVIVDDQQ
jgi:hypothetical protein